MEAVGQVAGDVGSRLLFVGPLLSGIFLSIIAGIVTAIIIIIRKKAQGKNYTFPWWILALWILPVFMFIISLILGIIGNKYHSTFAEAGKLAGQFIPV